MWDNRKMARLIELERKIDSNLHRSLPVTDFELLMEKISLETQLDYEINPRKAEDFLDSFVDISAITLGSSTTYEPIITLTSEEGWYNDISDSRRLLRTNSLGLH